MSSSSKDDQEWIVQVQGKRDINTSNWMWDLKKELEKFREAGSTELKRWENLSIYMIPQSLKELHRSAYEPQMVSIGPYHHGRPHLESMEEHKKRALLTFVYRSRKPLEHYVEALLPVVEDLKDAYQNLDTKWKEGTEAFLRLMLLDGCFLLELMRSTAIMNLIGYEGNDPVFSNHGKLCFGPYLKRDMLMLENQLPLHLLGRLLDTEDPAHIYSFDMKGELSFLIDDFFSLPPDVGNGESILLIDHESHNYLHILYYYRRSMLSMGLSGPDMKLPERGCSDCLLPATDPLFVLPATELKEAGIRFERSETRKPIDVSFRGGILRLPEIIVDESFESQYLNMMALERFHVDAGNEVASFVFFMGSIIKGPEDVALLHACGIIINAAGSHVDVTNLFKSLARDVTLDPYSRWADLYENVVRYCGMPLPRLKVSAKRMLHYFNNLVGLSIIGAVSLFALANIQTLYTILAYYHSKQ